MSTAGSQGLANTKPHESDLITVCSACLQASCWLGEFMCQESQTAGTVRRRRSELRALGLEHPSYWHTDAELSTGRKLR